MERKNRAVYVHSEVWHCVYQQTRRFLLPVRRSRVAESEGAASHKTLRR